MNKIKSLITISAFSLMVLCLPAIASAQYGGYGNGGYNNGQYGQYGNYGDMRSTIRDLKSKARDFQRQLDRDLDRGRYNGSRREDQINELARRFKDAVNDLNNNGYNNGRNNDNGRYNDNDRYDNGRYGNGNNNRGEAEMRRVFDLASQIERSFSRSNVSYNTQNIWSAIRSDLQVLSRSYGGYNNGRGNGGYGNGRGNGNGGGINNGGWNKPSWWPF